VGATSLLHHVRQLVCQKSAALGHLGLVALRTKDDVASDRVRLRIHGLGRAGGGGVRMDPNVPEVKPEPRCHERTGLEVKGLPALYGDSLCLMSSSRRGSLFRLFTPKHVARGILIVIVVLVHFLGFALCTLPLTRHGSRSELDV